MASPMPGSWKNSLLYSGYKHISNSLTEIRIGHYRRSIWRSGRRQLLDMAYGGNMGTSLFTNVSWDHFCIRTGWLTRKKTISASPYLPMQHGYKDWVPSQSYYAFAIAAGCPPTSAYGNSSQTIFDCLVDQNTKMLQNASQHVSGSGKYGTWAFLPVTDGSFIQQSTSQQLLQ